jgi:hypothetical protein
MLQSNDYRCKECSSVQTLLIEKEDRDKSQPCKCGGEAIRMLGGHITRATYLDGYNRWHSVKEMRKIDKEVQKLKRLRRAGKLDADTQAAETKRLKDERAQIQAKGRTKHAEIAPKVEG